jgi:hypothetical protein
MIIVTIIIMHDRDYDFKSNQGNHAMPSFVHGVQLYTRASGHARVPGLLIPSADIE